MAELPLSDRQGHHQHASLPTLDYSRPSPPQSCGQVSTSLKDSRILQFRRKGLMCKVNAIYEAEQQEPLYRVTIDSITKPHIRVYSGSTSTLMASASYRWPSYRIDVSLPSHPPITITSLGLLKNGYSYCSPTFGNSTVKWVRTGILSSRDLICLDDKEMPLARFEANRFTITKNGRFEILGDAAAAGTAAVEELVVTGLAMVELRRRE